MGKLGRVFVRSKCEHEHPVLIGAPRRPPDRGPIAIGACLT
jgi:hypothetical protein